MCNYIIHAAIVQSKLADRSIARPIYREILERYPLIREREDYKRTTGYLLLGPPFIDEETSHILYPSKLIASHMGKSSKHANTTAYLEEYKCDVAPDLVYSGYSKQEKKCRAILKTGMVDLVDAILEDSPKTRQYFYSGVTANNANQLAIDRRIKQEACKQQWLYSDQKIVADYLHKRPLEAFKRPIEEHYEEAKALARQADTPRKRRHQLLQLQATRDNPKPYYYPVENNARIYSQGGLILLPKEQRRALWPGLLEADLQSAHASIVASEWGAKETAAILLDGVRLWDEVVNQMGIMPEQRDIAIPIVKTGYYSVTYGMETGDVNKKVGLDLAGKHVQRRKGVRFSDTAIIADLLEAREKAEARIRKDGGAYGAYGFIPHQGLEMPSFHSHVHQTFELAILAESFKLAYGSQDFHIMYYQWDGFSFTAARSKQKRVITALQDATQRKARELGIHTKLVIEEH